MAGKRDGCSGARRLATSSTVLCVKYVGHGKNAPVGGCKALGKVIAIQLRRRTHAAVDSSSFAQPQRAIASGVVGLRKPRHEALVGSSLCVRSEVDVLPLVSLHFARSTVRLLLSVVRLSHFVFAFFPHSPSHAPSFDMPNGINPHEAVAPDYTTGRFETTRLPLVNAFAKPKNSSASRMNNTA